LERHFAHRERAQTVWGSRTVFPGCCWHPKHRGSNTVELDDEWKLFYFGVEPAKFAQAGVGILARSQLATSFVDEWIPLEERVCNILSLKLLGRYLCLTKVYVPNLSALYPEFVEKTSDTLRRVAANESKLLWGGFNAHFGNDAGIWKGVIGYRGDADVNDNGRLLLQLCCDSTLHTMNTFFQHNDLHKYTWCRVSLGQRWLVSFSWLVPISVRRSCWTGHKIINRWLPMVCNLRLKNPKKPTQTCRTRRSYRIKWEAPVDKAARKTFADSESSLCREILECTAEEEWQLFKAA